MTTLELVESVADHPCDPAGPATARGAAPTPAGIDVERATRAAHDLLEALGADLSGSGLADTPRRIAHAYAELLTARPFHMTTFPNDEQYDELVLARDIPFTSLCEHHALPFTGIAHVGYLPGDRIVGLSKLARVVEHFSRRLQVQERMTVQIADLLQSTLAPRGVGVVIEAEHRTGSPTGPGQEITSGSGRRPFTAPLTVCVPAHNEAATIARVLSAVLAGATAGTQVLVIDDGSTDDTAGVARHAGAEVVAADHALPGSPAGKGSAMATGLRHSRGDLVVFLDADVTDLAEATVARLVEPLLDDPTLVMTKATYARPLHGIPNEGGRVNALLARPLLRRCFPELSHLTQPLSGECAIRRSSLASIDLEPGYGVEVGLILDITARYGATAIAEVDLAVRTHRNRPLHELTGHADVIVDAILSRYERTFNATATEGRLRDVSA